MARELITNEQTIATAEAGHQALFPSGESDSFRNQWNDIQVSFLDALCPSVEKADQLIATVVQRLTQIYVEERSKLENEWAKRSEVSTEDLRQALRRYRTFFDRLLSA